MVFRRTNSATLLLLASLTTGGLWACFTGSELGEISNPSDAGRIDTGKAATAPSDLPCYVAEFLVANCLSCHGDTPVGNPLSLGSRAALSAKSATDPSKTVAELALARAQDSAKPMPPTGLLAASALEPLKGWIAEGMPTGNCSTAGADAGRSPYDTPTVCSSNSTWTRGNHGSKQMRPGGACIDCHKKEGEGPTFSIAGTVYPTAHEPNDCNGLEGAVVTVTDATGKVLTATSNAAGNFYLTTKITAPYRAKVSKDGKERVMSHEQTSGDCNTCHTEKGTEDAPGRIMAP